MPTERGSRKFFEKGIPIATGKGLLAIPISGTIAEVTMAADAAPTSAVCNVTKNGASASILSGAYDMSGLTAYTGKAIPLATAGPGMKVAAGDTLLVSSTVTTTGSMTCASVIVGVDPDYL